MLYLRMALYLVFGALAGQGLIDFDSDTGRVAFDVDDLMLAVTSLAGFVGTFIVSRFAAKK